MRDTALELVLVQGVPHIGVSEAEWTQQLQQVFLSNQYDTRSNTKLTICESTHSTFESADYVDVPTIYISSGLHGNHQS